MRSVKRRRRRGGGRGRWGEEKGKGKRAPGFDGLDQGRAGVGRQRVDEVSVKCRHATPARPLRQVWMPRVEGRSMGS